MNAKSKSGLHTRYDTHVLLPGWKASELAASHHTSAKTCECFRKPAFRHSYSWLTGRRPIHHTRLQCIQNLTTCNTSTATPGPGPPLSLRQPHRSPHFCSSFPAAHREEFVGLSTPSTPMPRIGPGTLFQKSLMNE